MQLSRIGTEWGAGGAFRHGAWAGARRIVLTAWLLALLLPAGGCSRSQTPEVASGPQGGEIAIEVRTARVRRGELAERVSAPGSLLARRESRIGTEVQGRIQRIFVEEGDRVEAEVPLFQIDPEPFEYALRQSEAQLDLARAERRQIEADLARARVLQERDVLPQQEFDRLATSRAVASARERQAAEAVALARRNLERTTVRAPYAGSVAARLEDEGTTALVQPQTIVIVFQETAELEARATIPESRLHAVRVGDPARIHVEGLADPIATEVASVGDSIDPQTRTYQVTMRVPNPERVLKAGVFGSVEILPRSRRHALLVPREAIRSEGGRTRVLAVREGRAVPVPVDVGVVAGDLAEILSGLAEGDEVIAGSAASEVAPGMPVRPLEEAMAARAGAAEEGP